jgi:hypothetical protein
MDPSQCYQECWLHWDRGLPMNSTRALSTKPYCKTSGEHNTWSRIYLRWIRRSCWNQNDPYWSYEFEPLSSLCAN